MASDKDDPCLIFDEEVENPLFLFSFQSFAASTSIVICETLFSKAFLNHHFQSFLIAGSAVAAI